MKNHYDRKIVYSTEREHESLYKWSLKELDSGGTQVGGDWLQWAWSLEFKAQNASIQQSWSTHDRYAVSDGNIDPKIIQSRFIHAELEPFSHDGWPPRYSMLGSDRTVTNFILRVEQISDEQAERCTLDGMVQSTMEINFRDVTQEDTLWIYFHFHAATFARYADRIIADEVDSLRVRIGRVAGFYADWSPSITTDRIGILTSNSDHEVGEVPEDVSLARLGDVGEANLYLAREANLRSPAVEVDEANEIDGVVDVLRSDEVVVPDAVTEWGALEIAKLVRSLRFAAWCAVALLFALLMK